VSDYYTPWRPHARILSYAESANGDAPPLSILRGKETELDAPSAIALDDIQQLYVTNGYFGHNSITVYAADRSGRAQPIQDITGPATGLDTPQGLAVDSARNIYVANAPGRGLAYVTEYPAGATGNVAPIRTIVGENTGLKNSSGLAVDAGGNIYVANDALGRFPGGVTVYAARAVRRELRSHHGVRCRLKRKRRPRTRDRRVEHGVIGAVWACSRC
jgi:hypothetical protein